MLGFLMPFRGQRGLTLLELMVVLSLICILAGVGAPSFSSMMERRQLTEAAESARNAMLVARSEAVRSNGSVYLHLWKKEDDWCGWVDRDAQGETCPDAQSPVIARFGSGTVPGVVLSFPKGGGLVTFDPARGTVRNEAALTLESSSGWKVNLSVDPLSGVITCSDDLYGYQPCDA